MRKTYLLFLLALFLPLLCCAQVVQQGINIGLCPQGAPTCGPTLASLAIVPANPTVVNGQTQQMGAAGVESDGTSGGLKTPQCDGNWTSDTPAVATVSSTGLVTAASSGTGTAKITCQLQTNTAILGSTTVTVLAAPHISFPICPPCTLPTGTNGSAYSQTLLATGGSLPYTWDCNGSCAGLLPTGLSLTSGGVLSGTPTVNGTTSWTLRVRDNGGNPATASASLTISGTVLGPPTYLGSTASTANPGAITPYFSSSSAQNTCTHDPTLNPSTDPITLATTASSSRAGMSQGGSFSGGANGHDWSWDETMLAVGDVGGGASILGITTNGAGCAQVTNTGVPVWSTGILGSLAFDWYTAAGRANHDVYLLKSKHIIQKATVADINVNSGFTTIFDYAAVNACPGPVPSPVTSASIWEPVAGSGGGLRFTIAMGVGNQGTATAVFSWDPALGCTSVDLQNGLYYPWCLANCSTVTGLPLSTTGNYCYGFSSLTDAIHDGQPSGDGTVIRLSVISGGHTMTHGVCVGATVTGTVAWGIGTGTTIYTNGERTGGATCPVAHCDYDGHPSEGNTKAIGSGPDNFNIRSVSNYSGAFTIAAPKLQTFATNGVPNDNHGAWPTGGNLLDAFPMWVGATDRIVAASVSPCAPTSAVYCPPYLANVLFALPIDGSNANPRLFVHTHSCDVLGDAACTDGPDSYFGSQEGVPSVSPQGHYASWPCTDLHSFGLDGSGKFRSNICIVHLQ